MGASDLPPALLAMTAPMAASTARASLACSSAPQPRPRAKDTTKSTAGFWKAASAGSSRRAVEEFDEFCRWWEDWYGPKAQIPYCALWSHHVPGELWALMHGNPVKLSSPTACRVPSCPHRAWPPFTGTPKEAMREMRQLLDHVVEKIVAP